MSATAGVVVPLVREAHRDALAFERPQLFDQAVVELACPLAGEEGFDLGAPARKLGAVAPRAVRRVRERHALRIATVPGVFGGAHLL